MHLQKTAGGILLPKAPPKANSDAHIGEVSYLGGVCQEIQQLLRSEVRLHSTLQQTGTACVGGPNKTCMPGGERYPSTACDAAAAMSGRWRCSRGGHLLDVHDSFRRMAIGERSGLSARGAAMGCRLVSWYLRSRERQGGCEQGAVKYVGPCTVVVSAVQ